MISIIIPTFGDFNRVTKLINSIKKHERDSSCEIIVIDDNPKTSFNVVGATVIHNKTNLGFAASVNKGMAVAQGSILLLLNDDIILTSPVFSILESRFTEPNLGIIGALLRYPTKTVQHGGMLFDSKLKSFIHEKDLKKSTTRYCISVTGAFFAISREAYKKLGSLNEKYFLACEDTDYCIRAWKAGFTVKFVAELDAIHEEGATRGNTPQKKKHNVAWTTAEIVGINKFKDSLDLKGIAEAEKKIRMLNKSTIKIEVGSGYNPQPGYLHLDVRPKLPQLDFVCDFVRQALPFKDAEVSEIVANHVIEHIPYRKIPFVVREWARVLEDGGKLLLRTPNLRFICETYLKGETTPEWPGDEKFITDNLASKITPAWWANIKLFSGQDYDANFHHVCFDFEMLRDLLNHFGFGSVELTKFDKTYSPGELQVVAYRGKFTEEVLIVGASPYIEKKKSCCVIRHGAMGDVILTTPIIERLSKDYATIDVITKCPEIFKYNPHIRRCIPPSFVDPDSITWKKDYDKIIDLNLAYEKHPKRHIIDAYCGAAFGDYNIDFNTYLYAPPEVKEDYIVIHAAKSWENRTWSKLNWDQVIDDILQTGRKVVLVGAGSDYNGGQTHMPKGLTTLVGLQRFWELVSTIQKAHLFIGMDSGPMHIAESVGTKAIGIYTCAKPEYRTIKDKNSTLAITSDIDCFGCLHDVPPPVTFCSCRRGDFKCLDLITPEMVFEKVCPLLA